jgi:glycosyltransferase involved in cell wall biosynthesis
MHIAMCSPATLTLLSDLVKHGNEMPPGYRFPLMSQLVRSYIDCGHQVSLVTHTPEVTETRKWRGEKLTVIVTPRRRARYLASDFFRREVKLMVNALRNVQPDVIHAHWTYEFADAALQTQRFPVLVTAHDSPWRVAKAMNTLYRWIRAAYSQFRILPRVRHLTAVSPYIAHELKNRHFFNRPIRIVPNGIDQAQAAPFPRERPLNSAYPVVASISEWGKHKNIIVVLHAFASFRKFHPRATLLLFGNGLGPGEDAAIYCREHGIAAGIEFRGYTEHGETLRELRERTDIFVHSALEESFCMTILEAMSQGVPCIGGKNSGAVPWLLENGKAGVLADVRDPQAIASAMNQLLVAPALYHRLSTVALARCRSEFNLWQVTKSYLHLLTSISSSG